MEDAVLIVFPFPSDDIGGVSLLAVDTSGKVLQLEYTSDGMMVVVREVETGGVDLQSDLHLTALHLAAPPFNGSINFPRKFFLKFFLKFFWKIFQRYINHIRIVFRIGASYRIYCRLKIIFNFYIANQQ
eukprot:sb/3475273/